MSNTRVDDLNVLSDQTLRNGEELKDSVPGSPRAMGMVVGGRLTIKKTPN